MKFLRKRKEKEARSSNNSGDNLGAAQSTSSSSSTAGNTSNPPSSNNHPPAATSSVAATAAPSNDTLLPPSGSAVSRTEGSAAPVVSSTSSQPTPPSAASSPSVPRLTRSPTATPSSRSPPAATSQQHPAGNTTATSSDPANTNHHHPVSPGMAVWPPDVGTVPNKVSSHHAVLSTTPALLVGQELVEQPGTFQYLADAGSVSLEELNPYPELPLLRDTPATEHQTLFTRKLQACSIVYDFTRDDQQKAKEGKRQTLLELVEYVNNTRSCFSESVMPVLIQMVAANIFRSLPPPPSHASGATYDPEDDEPAVESSWPHLQIVYEFFLRFVVSTEVDPKAAKRFINQQFVLKLLDLFSSEDPRERDYLKTILHRIYGKIMALRSFIRRAIQHVFLRFIYEHEGHKGISELLEILGSIINGFSLPLKEEHKVFLEKSLMPLHKAKSLSAFSQQLTYCMTQYVEKDSRLAAPVISGLLKFWPATNTNKELVFLNELEEILELTQLPELQKVMNPLFKRLALCIESPHFQVAERVLFLWNNDYIVTLFNSHKQQLFPSVISALFKNSNEHWNSTVHGLTYNVKKLLAEYDPKLYDECSDRYSVIEEQNAKKREERERKWDELETKVVLLANSNAKK